MGMEQKMMIALVVAHHSLIFGKGAFIKDTEIILAQEPMNQRRVGETLLIEKIAGI